ncbi:MAG TPA: 50S ribosomal protein L15 [Gaiellaceae bacterium]|nr:50S ribosomal protein L15 [Gaiellaceae bacterium]
MPAELNLSTLQPAQKRRGRKRVGRGLGSGKGRYSGRGIKGQKARSGSHTMRAGFEGGQMPISMRLGKQRGPTSKDAMPIGPHRTRSQGVNVAELERVFDAGAEVTPEALKAKRLIRSTRVDVKILGCGDLAKALVVYAHAFSVSAREKIEAAGGRAVWLRGEPGPRAGKRTRARQAPPAGEPRPEPEPTGRPAGVEASREPEEG